MNELPIRDIHLSGDASWWPLAWGWWIVIALLLAAALVAGWQWFRRWQRARRIRELKSQLFAIRGRVDDDARYLAEISAFLRRLFIHRGNREDVAGLAGRDWAIFLNDSANDQIADLIANGPYRRQVKVDRQRVEALACRWIEQVEQAHGAPSRAESRVQDDSVDFPPSAAAGKAGK